MAYSGLEKSNINKTDINKYLSIIEDRVDTHQTGSIWLAKSNWKLRKKYTTDIANAALTASLYKNQIKGKPVHLWNLASGKVGYDIDMGDIKLEKFMTTEVFVVHENDLVDLVNKIMEWKIIHHLPVVNNKNKVVGIITKTNLPDNRIVKKKSLAAKDIMIKDIITVSADISILEAKEIMIKNNIGCLPILEDGDLIGILTKRDVEKLEKIPQKND